MFEQSQRQRMQHWEKAVIAKNRYRYAVRFAGVLSTSGIYFKSILNANVTQNNEPPKTTVYVLASCKSKLSNFFLPFYKTFSGMLKVTHPKNLKLLLKNDNIH